jgi:hypothetical protein
MAQSPQSQHSPEDRDPSQGEGAFVLLMAIVPTTFIVILAGILALQP